MPGKSENIGETWTLLFSPGDGLAIYKSFDYLLEIFTYASIASLPILTPLYLLVVGNPFCFLYDV